MIRRPPTSTLFPSTPLSRSRGPQNFARRDEDTLVARARNLEEDLVLPLELDLLVVDAARQQDQPVHIEQIGLDRKSTRLNSSHGYISYAVFCLKKKKHTHTH